MHTIEIPEANIKQNLPAELAECNTVQYINFCKLLYKKSIGEIDHQTLKDQAIYFIANIKFKNKEKIKEDDAAFINLSLLSDLIDSFFELDEKENTVIKQYFIHNPIEKVFGAGKHYFGPSDEFNNVSFGEYVDALSFLYDYIETKDDHFLYLLFATFYREKEKKNFTAGNFKKDKRVVYNPERTELLAEKFKYLDKGIIYGFFILFTSFQKYLTSAKIYVQGKEIDLSLLYKDFSTDKKQPESEFQGIGMKSLLYTIAESGIFGTEKEVRKAPLWEILIRFYDIRKRDFDALKQQQTPT
jgi:hypothetical protein